MVNNVNKVDMFIMVKTRLISIVSKPISIIVVGVVIVVVVFVKKS